MHLPQTATSEKFFLQSAAVSIHVRNRERTDTAVMFHHICLPQSDAMPTPTFLSFWHCGWRGGEEAFYLTYHLVSFLFSLDEPLNSNTNTSSEDHRCTTRPANLGCRGTTALPLPATGWPGQSACSLTIVSAEGYLLSRWHIFLIHFGSKART